MNRSLKIVSVIFGMCAGCGEPAPPSLPLSVVPQGYAIVSGDWTPNQVSVCDLVLTSKSAEDIRVKVEVTRPGAGVVFTETVTLPSKGRAFVSGHLRSKTLEELKKLGHIQPGDTVELSKYDCKPLIIPIPAAGDLEILYLSPANGLMAIPSK